MKVNFLIFLGLVFLSGTVLAQSASPIYENNFQKADTNTVPDDLMVLDGDFSVRQDGTNKFLELPGEPLDSFKALFGPALEPGASVTACFYGTAKGRRAPSFGLGLNGVNGYRLMVSAGKGTLEILKGDESVASIPFKWQSAAWTFMRLQIVPAKDQWHVLGKAWPESGSEPSEWMIAFDATTKPPTGKASLWGSPFSGTPIRFDDLRIVTATGK